MAVSKKDVEHVALLARLRLSDDEAEVYTKQLSQILEHAGKISELDTSDFEPTSHPLPVKNVYREDEVRVSLSKDDVLLNAPERESGAFKVPKII